MYKKLILISMLVISGAAFGADDSKLISTIWNFDDGSSIDWTTGFEKITQSDGSLIINAPAGKKTWLISPKNSFTPYLLDYVYADVSSDADVNIAVAFRSEKLYQWSDDKTVAAVAVKGGTWQKLEFDMKQHPLWTPTNGYVIQIAFIIDNPGNTDVKVKFDSIKVIDEPADKWMPQVWAQPIPKPAKLEAQQPSFQNKFTSYIDEETGNEVVRLLNMPLNVTAAYHYYKTFSLADKYLFFRLFGDETPQYDGYYNLDLATGNIERVTGEKAGFGVVTPDGRKFVYWEKRPSFRDKTVNSLWSLDIETKERKWVYDLSVGMETVDFNVTADSRYAVIQIFKPYEKSAEEMEKAAKMLPRDAAMYEVFLRNRNRPRYEILKIDIENPAAYQLGIIDQPTMHNQCSTTDKDTLLVQWQSFFAQPFWLVNLNDGSYSSVIDENLWNEKYRYTIFGHPCWSLDGKYIWSEGREWIDKWSKEFDAIYHDQRYYWTNEKQWSICKFDIVKKDVKIWPVDINGWSVHYTPTKWDNILTCDGHNFNRYISLIAVNERTMEYKQVMLCKVPHDYMQFEPSCHLTPDGKGVVFDTAIDGVRTVCMVRVPDGLIDELIEFTK